MGSIDILGLERARAVHRRRRRRPAEGPRRRPRSQQVSRFARLAAENLDVSQPILASIGSPVRVKQTIVKGGRTSLDSFAVAVAVAVSLMFVTLLLAAGLLALEREEQAFGRLVRGLVSRTALLAEKVVLSAVCALVVTLLMLFGLAAFVGLDWSRIPPGWPRWPAARSASRRWAWRSAASRARSAPRRCWPSCWRCRSCSSRSCPSGSVSPALYDAVNVISGLFPFKPALRALDGAINGGELLAARSCTCSALTAGLLACWRGSRSAGSADLVARGPR